MDNSVQNNIIESRGKNIIVTASAGCGKTTTMIRRILDLILHDGVPVKSLLIVTFTNASAIDMREKLRKSLSAHADQPFVRRQLSDLETADISTLDSFCSRLLRRYFYKLGLDPAFEIVDEESARLLQIKTLQKIIREFYAENDPDFNLLTQILCKNRSDKELFAAVYNLYRTAACTEDPTGYLRKISIACQNPSADNPALLYLANFMKEDVLARRESVQQLIRECERAGLSADAELLYAADGILAGFPCSYTAQTRFISEFSFPLSVKPLKKEQKENFICVELHEQVKDQKKALGDTFKNWAERYPLYSEKELAQNFEQTTRLISMLAEITLRFAETYRREKRADSQTDFNDLSQYTLDLLADAEVVADLRRQYRYVFLDESQDINGMQNRMIHGLAGTDNLFSVGDLKQCIYRFRGAEPEIFHANCTRAEQDPNTELYRLGINYRTDSRILDFVNQIFSQLMIPSFSMVNYAAEDCLIGARTGVSAAPVELCILTPPKDADPREQELDEETEELSSAEIEAQEIVNIVDRLVNSPMEDPLWLEARRSAGLPDKVMYSDIAILVRSNHQVSRTVSEALKRAQIPVTADFSAGIAQYPDILLLLEFLKLLDNGKQDLPLLAVMKSLFGGFSDDELGQIRLEFPQEVCYYACLDRYALEGADQGLQKKCVAFLDACRRYRSYAEYRTADEVLERIVRDFDYEAFVLAGESGRENLTALQQFLEHIHGKKYAANLFDFLSYLNYFGDEFKLSNLPSTAYDCIKLTTMHKSKGLEYPIVILCGLHHNFNQTDARNTLLIDRQFGCALNFYREEEKLIYPSPIAEAIKCRVVENSVKEELNTLYVAMTRPKYKLIMTGCLKKESRYTPYTAQRFRSLKNFWEAIISITEEFQPANVRIRRVEGSPDMRENGPYQVALSRRHNAFTEAILEAYREEYAYPDSMHIRLKNTVSELNRTEARVLFDAGSSDVSAELRTELGNLYHQVFELLPLRETAESDSVLSDAAAAEEGVSADDGIQRDLNAMADQGYLSREQLKEIDVASVAAFRKNIQPYLNGKILREQPFLVYLPHKLLGGKTEDRVLVQGKIDLLIVGTSEVTLIDYKLSGKSDQALRESYQKQLDCYALAVQSVLGREVTRKLIYSIPRRKFIEM